MEIESLSDREIVIGWNTYSGLSWKLGSESKFTQSQPITGFVDWIQTLPPDYVIPLGDADRMFCDYTRKHAAARKHSRHAEPGDSFAGTTGVQTSNIE